MPAANRQRATGRRRNCVNRNAQCLAVKTRFKDVGFGASACNTQPETGGLAVPEDALLVAALALETGYSVSREIFSHAHCHSLM
jgi:hypothetical protein